jgi:phospholipase C
LDAHKISWRWYSYDPGTLRCGDARYMLDPAYHDNFAYVAKTKLSWKTRIEEEILIDESSSSFLEDAARGALPAVAWIDPNFSDINVYGSNSNDDHPPSDITHGQDLVLLIYHALATSPQWAKTLFVITYDEHGGFFDHVPPLDAADDDAKNFGRYGLRVPAIVISPFVEPGTVSNTLFDHTTLIKTILLRFCAGEIDKPDAHHGLLAWLDLGHPHYMGKRVSKANDLGPLLTRDSPRPAPDYSGLLADSAKRASAAAAARVAQPVDTATDKKPLTDLQIRIARAASELRQKGLPPGQP